MAALEKNYYYEIDILRGIACLTVFFSHFPLPFMCGATWDVAGCNGVYVFFVISGFIISKSFGAQLEKIDSFSIQEWSLIVKKNMHHISLFWYRRFIRLFPAFFCLMCCLFLITLHYGIKNSNLFDSMVEFFRLVANFLLLDNCMNNEYSDITRLLYWKAGVIWSLDCEILFYLLFPFIVIYKRINATLTFLLIMIFIIKSILYYFIEFKYLYYSLLANLDFFILGILVANFHDRISFNKNVLVLLTWVSLYTLIFTSASFEIYRFYLSGFIISGILVYAASTKQKILCFPVLGTVLHFIGIRSYFIYLMHVITQYILEISIVKSFNEHFTWYNQCIYSKYLSSLLLLVFMVIISDIFYRYIEQPYIKKRKIDHHFGLKG
jgi:peptidoglycan/LPS O-acetylase OafA/YrhL